MFRDRHTNRKAGNRNWCKAAVEKPHVQLLGWDPSAQLCKVAIFQACTTASLSLRVAWISSLWGWAAVEASFRLWSKGSRAESESQNKPSWSWEHKTVRAYNRVRGQGEPSTITMFPPVLFHPKSPDSTSGTVQNPWHNRTHLKLERPSYYS